jgi:hypothetical protein
MQVHTIAHYLIGRMAKFLPLVHYTFFNLFTLQYVRNFYMFSFIVVKKECQFVFLDYREIRKDLIFHTKK